MLSAGIQDKLAFRYPIKKFGYDKSSASKNLAETEILRAAG